MVLSGAHLEDHNLNYNYISKSRGQEDSQGDRRRRSSKQLILDKALNLIVTYGIRGFTIRKLAREVGLTEGAIYRHFSSKDEIIRQVITERVNPFFKENFNRIVEKFGYTKEALRTLFFWSLDQEKLKDFNLINFLRAMVIEIYLFGTQELKREVLDGLTEAHSTLSEFIKRVRENMYPEPREDKVDDDTLAFMILALRNAIIYHAMMLSTAFNVSEKELYEELGGKVRCVWEAIERLL